MGGTDEFSGGDVRGRDAFFFEIDNIVRTARNAGPSIAEGFDDRVTFLASAQPEWVRGAGRATVGFMRRSTSLTPYC